MNEMKIYEKLGIKKFKKFVFGISYVVMFPFMLMEKKTFKDAKKVVNEASSNYSIGKNLNYEGIKEFKKMIYLNSFIHISALIGCIYKMPNIIENASIIPIIIESSLITLNTYCLMLQRYNYIRINKTINMLKPKYENEKNKIKEEIKENDSKLINHEFVYITYNCVRTEEKSVNFDELLEKASLEKLKEYRNKLSFYSDNAETISKYEEGRLLPITINNDKFLKIKIKNK